MARTRVVLAAISLLTLVILINLIVRQKKTLSIINVINLLIATNIYSISSVMSMKFSKDTTNKQKALSETRSLYYSVSRVVI